jgi:reactive intermediate/imine deaminase
MALRTALAATFLLSYAAAVSAADVEVHSSGIFEGFDLPFSEAVEVNGIVFLSGQIGVTPGTLEVVDGGMEAEARRTMDNIAMTLEAAGLSMADVVKCTVMLDDMADWPAFNEVYVTYFEPPYPARSALGADGLALGAAVEVECIAAR